MLPPAYLNKYFHPLFGFPLFSLLFSSLTLHSVLHLEAFTLLFLSLIASHLGNLWTPTPLEEMSWINNNIFLALKLSDHPCGLLTQRGTRLKLFYGLCLMSSTYLPTKTCLLLAIVNPHSPHRYSSYLSDFSLLSEYHLPHWLVLWIQPSRVDNSYNASLCSLRKPYHWLYYHGLSLATCLSPKSEVIYTYTWSTSCLYPL